MQTLGGRKKQYVASELLNNCCLSRVAISCESRSVRSSRDAQRKVFTEHRAR